MRNSPLLVLSLLLVTAAPVFGQEVLVGAPIRIELAQSRGQQIDGELLAITDDSIFIARKHRRDVRVPRARVQTLYTGRHNSPEQAMFAGVLVGAPIGMLAGAAAGVIIPKAGSGRRAIGAVAGAAGGIVVGAILGGIIGEHSPITTWYEVPWPTPVHR